MQHAIEYLSFFLNLGLQQGLSHTIHPISLLQQSLNELGAANPPPFESGIRHVAHNQLNPANFTLQLRYFIFNDIPVFNIWDAIALIYSISIEEVFCDQEAELFLYQLRLILNALKNTAYWGTDFSPSTVAASWTKTGHNGHLIVAYDVSCIPGKKGKLRAEQNLARQNYNRRLHSLVMLSDDELRNLDRGSNKAGNCPEYTTWATICTGPGMYKSLCLSIAEEQTFQFCGPCDQTAKAARSVGIVIEDRWNLCSLVSSAGEEARNKGGYTFKAMDSIRGGGRKVQKKRKG